MKQGPIPPHLIAPKLSLQILATSASNHAHRRFTLPTEPRVSSRELCSDQKGFFAHLHQKSLFISTTRVAFLQISQAFTSYLTDQLKHESDLEDSLTAGKISGIELEIQNDEWEEREWKRIWTSLPGKIRAALIKYHALILIMRSYEKMIEYVVDKQLMDKLTKDSFKSAIRKSKEIESGERSSEGYAREMFDTCLYSNAISFLADHTVQQVILAYGYYTFVKRERRLNYMKRDEDQLAMFSTSGSTSLEDDLFLDPDSDDILKGDGNGEEKETDPSFGKENNKTDGKSTDLSRFDSDQAGGILLSFMYKSSQLLVTRAIGLFTASVGGAFGSLIRPGWGTLCGIQLGDACVAAFLDA